MSNDVAVKVIESVLTIVVLLLTSVVIPWIKSKTDEETMKKVLQYAEIGVRCAEQIFDVEQYSEKKTFVSEYLYDVAHEKLNINLSMEDINNIIESTVNMVKYGSEYTR